MLKMQFMSKSLIAVTAMALVLTQGFISCSDDNASVSPESPEMTISMGVFLDSEVEGLTYQSGDSPPAVTDANGIFIYTPGQPISFSVGGVQLGTLPVGSPLITPNNFTIPENIARFLQSLDDDNDPSNGINVTAASTALAGLTVSSDVFENPSATGFATDPAIVSALAVAEKSLIDAETASANLRDGTHGSFDPDEIADKVFIVSDPLEDGLGYIQFDQFLAGQDSGSTAHYMPYSEFVVHGGTGKTELLSWRINAEGEMIMTSDGKGVIVLIRSGGSSSSISVLRIDLGEAPRPITLIKQQIITETELSGNIVGQGILVIGIHNLSNGGEIRFRSNGTMSSTGMNGEEPYDGAWSLRTWPPNSVRIIKGYEYYVAPNDWKYMVFLGGSLDKGLSFFQVNLEVTEFDNNPTIPSPTLEWQSFSQGQIRLIEYINGTEGN